jgi:hypothetical protein
VVVVDTTVQPKAVAYPTDARQQLSKAPEGDRINAVLAAAGYNFGLLLRWLAELLRALIMALAQSAPHAQNV